MSMRSRWLAVVVLLGGGFCLTGCGGAPAPADNDEGRVTPTGLNSGDYVGESSCTRGDDAEGEGDSFDIAVRISSDGLPVEDGRQVAVGQTSEQTSEGVTNRTTVTAVDASDNTVTVEKSVAATTEDGAEFSVSVVETYSRVSATTIRYFADWEFRDAESEEVVETRHCEAELVRASS